MIIFKNYGLALFVFIGLIQCKGSSGGGSSGSGAAKDSLITITGNLALSGEFTPDENALNNQGVELIDDTENVIAKTQTTSGGPFTLSINPDELSLTEGTGSKLQIPKIARLQSLFLVQADSQKDAAGLRQPIVINQGEMTQDENNNMVLETGTHVAKKVGAIVGIITLETGEDPTGTDVYIPGTTHIAKTDETGQFLLGFLPVGTFKIRADRIGYNSIEWPQVVVAQKATTHLDSTVMEIARGPKIEEFSLSAYAESTGNAKLKIRIKSASKYRVSKLSDFSDTVYQPMNVNSPEFTLPIDIGSNAKVVTIYLEATDSDGLSANSSLVIDKEAPLLGSIAVSTNNGFANSTTLSLTMSALNATKMKVAESTASLATTQWVTYATSYRYPLTDTSEGARTLYAAFSDNAGNILGADNSIYTSFVLDLTPPSAVNIVLLPPDSPSGDFAKHLAWQSFFDEEVTFYVEVFGDPDFSGDALRTMDSTKNYVNVKPVLTSVGTYYWRVRAEDQAGNLSDWVESGEGKKFVLNIFAEQFQAKNTYQGDKTTDQFYANNMEYLGYIDNKPAVAITIPSTSHSAGAEACQSCGVVKVVDASTWDTLGTVSEFLDKEELYGQKIISCDLTGDGTDELIVSAPGKRTIKTINDIDRSVNNAGKVYVYQMSDVMSSSRPTALAETEPSLSSQALGVLNCRNWGNNWQDCWEYGYPVEPSALQHIPSWNGEGVFFGYDLACERRSGKDRLIVSEIGHYDVDTAMPKGAVYIYELNETSLEQQGDLLLSPNNWSTFGISVAYFSNLKFASCNSSTAGPMIAVGDPTTWAGGANKSGVVYLFDSKSNGNWVNEPCDDTIQQPTSQPQNMWVQNFGVKIANLGDVDKDNGTDKMAISGFCNPQWSCWNSYSVVYFYDETSALKQPVKFLEQAGDNQFNFNVQEKNLFGYLVKTVGDFSGDTKTEIAISDPGAKINGRPGTGVVKFFKWADLPTASDQAIPSPVKTVYGSTEINSNFGASLVSIPSSTGTMHSSPRYLQINRPGKSMESTDFVGAVEEFGNVKMKIGLSNKIVGSNTNAKLGHSLLYADYDIDEDGIKDFVIGQPGGICLGRPWGAISLFSSLDKKITWNICANNSSANLGQEIIRFSSDSDLLFSAKTPNGNSSYDLYLYGVGMDGIGSFLKSETVQTLTISGKIADGTISALASNNVSFSEPLIRGGTNYFLTGMPQYKNGNNNDNQGKLSVFEYSDTNTLTERCSQLGVSAGDKFGNSVSIGDFDKDGKEDWIVGAPGVKTTVNGNNYYGKVYVYTSATINNCNTLLFSIAANDSVITDSLGTAANDGFGSYVLSLGDLDGAGANDMYFLVANSNVRLGDSPSNPQYIIFAAQLTGGTGTEQDPYIYHITVVKTESGESGSMLGGLAKMIPDVNNDTVNEIMLSAPGGLGTYGLTGQIRILAGGGILTTNDPSDDLLQMIYNPDPGKNSNFGVSLEYADITGDGLPDILIGADGYNSSQYRAAGAVYMFPLEPVSSE